MMMEMMAMMTMKMAQEGQGLPGGGQLGGPYHMIKMIVDLIMTLLMNKPCERKANPSTN